MPLPLHQGRVYPHTTTSATLEAPAALEVRPQWVAWRYEQRSGRGKWAKVPIDPHTGRKAKTDDPETWGTYSEAVATAEERGLDGVGFVLTPEDPFSFLDLDDVRDRETGEIEAWALEAVEGFASYTEISPSGTGLRIAIKARMPFKKAGTKPVEFFSGGGYVTITGNALLDTPIQERQEELESYYRKIYPVSTPSVAKLAASEAGPGPMLSDGEVVEKARTGRFGHDFAALYDPGGLSGFGGDASRADNALMGQLAFWCSHDAAQMERIFSESALGQRQKWRNRPNYRRDTVAYAIKHNKPYTPEKHRPKETKVRDRLAVAVDYARFVHQWGEFTGNARSASSDYFGYFTLLKRAYRANSMEIDISVRDYKDYTGLGNNETAQRSLTRLEDLHGLVKKVRDGDHGNAARYRIQEGSIPEHIEIQGYSPLSYPPCVNKTYVPVLIPEGYSPELIRHPGPTTDKTHNKNGRRIPQATGDPLRSVGKPAAMALDIAQAAVARTGEVVPVSFLSARIGTSLKNFKARQGRDLVNAGLLVGVAELGGYLPPENVVETLERELEDSGALRRHEEGRKRTAKDQRVQRVKHLSWLGMNEERIAFTTGYAVEGIRDILTPPNRAPTALEMEQERHERQIRNASGTYAELVKESPFWEGEFPAPTLEPGDTQPPLGHDCSPVPPGAPVTDADAPPKVEVPHERSAALEGRTDTTKTGAEIVAEFAEAADHSLSCDCVACSVSAPRFAVVNLDEYILEEAERVAEVLPYTTSTAMR